MNKQEQVEQFAGEVDAVLDPIAAQYVEHWVQLAGQALDWGDDEVKRLPHEHLQMVVKLLNAGKVACMLAQPFERRPDGKRVSKIQSDIKRKYGDWAYLAAQAGHREPGAC